MDMPEKKSSPGAIPIVSLWQNGNVYFRHRIGDGTSRAGYISLHGGLMVLCFTGYTLASLIDNQRLRSLPNLFFYTPARWFEVYQKSYLAGEMLLARWFHASGDPLSPGNVGFVIATAEALVLQHQNSAAAGYAVDYWAVPDWVIRQYAVTQTIMVTPA